MKYRRLTKVRKGTLAWIDRSKNPQKYGDEVTGTVTEIIGMGTFTDPAYGIDSLLKVKYESGTTRGIGYILEVIQY